MQDQLQHATVIRRDRKIDRTYVGVKISAPSLSVNLKTLKWEDYVDGCRQSLHRLAHQESIEILVWSIDVDWKDELILITHHVYTRGQLLGTLPMRVDRALRPASGYLLLDRLALALKKGWPVRRFLTEQVESHRLQRYGRNGKRLKDHIPEQLLARAVSDPGWRKLLSPTDKPWAFINTVTQRMYAREYAQDDSSTIREPVPNSSPAAENSWIDDQPTGGELILGDTLSILQAAGCTADSISVFMGRAQGKKWHELPKYLTGNTGTAWDARRVEAARASFKRHKSKLRAAAAASSRWRPRPNRASVYRERLPDGSAWSGLWTYCHRDQGAQLEVIRAVVAQERENLFREN